MYVNDLYYPGYVAVSHSMVSEFTEFIKSHLGGALASRSVVWASANRPKGWSLSFSFSLPPSPLLSLKSKNLWKKCPWVRNKKKVIWGKESKRTHESTLNTMFLGINYKSNSPRNKRTNHHNSSLKAIETQLTLCPNKSLKELQFLPSVAGTSNWLGSADSEKKHMWLYCNIAQKLLSIIWRD